MLWIRAFMFRMCLSPYHLETLTSTAHVSFPDTPFARTGMSNRVGEAVRHTLAWKRFLARSVRSPKQQTHHDVMLNLGASDRSVAGLRPSESFEKSQSG